MILALDTRPADNEAILENKLAEGVEAVSFPVGHTGVQGLDGFCVLTAPHDIVNPVGYSHGGSAAKFELVVMIVISRRGDLEQILRAGDEQRNIY